MCISHPRDKSEDEDRQHEAQATQVDKVEEDSRKAQASTRESMKL
jgi:hypothetical protein